MAGRTLAEQYQPIEGLYTHAEYRERTDFRFVHDHKPHHHAALTATYDRARPHFAHRHWCIQDVYDTRYVHRMLRLAAAYGMNGIQFSGDNIYWVNDALYRYNVFPFVGELCERCHDHGLKAYFWTHEINGFFHEFVAGGRYGTSGQLIGGTMDLSSASGYWQALRDKYDVFLRRLPGVDGLVLTLNECQVPVFLDERVRSDLSAAERVTRITRTILDVCRAHGRHLIVRTFCYEPAEAARIRRGLEALGERVTLMMKCVPHDWNIFLPDDPQIAAFRGWDTIVEHDLALEFMGDGRTPAPQVDYLKRRFDHAVAQEVRGVSGRLCRFRTHAEHTLNWAHVYAFSRFAQDPRATADAVWRDYATADYGAAAADFVVQAGRRLFAIGQETYYLAHEHRNVSNLHTFPTLANWVWWNCAKWSPEDPAAQALYRQLCAPTPAFIRATVAAKEAALVDVARLRTEVEAHAAALRPPDLRYFRTVLPRVAVVAAAHIGQHVVELMVRHDASRPPAERQFAAEIAARIAGLRELIATQRALLVAGGVEGNQHSDLVLEVFCRNAERHLAGR